MKLYHDVELLILFEQKDNKNISCVKFYKRKVTFHLNYDEKPGQAKNFSTQPGLTIN